MDAASAWMQFYEKNGIGNRKLKKIELYLLKQMIHQKYRLSFLGRYLIHSMSGMMHLSVTVE